MLNGMTSPPSSPVCLAVVLACAALLGIASRAKAAPPVDGGSDAFHWGYDAGPPPSLAYGETETDNVWASFACKARSGRVELHITSNDEPKHAYGSILRARVRMASGGSRRVYLGSGRGGPMAAQVLAVLSLRDPRP